MSNEVYDVAVVGAGPAGATAAISLARKKRDVVLIDRETFPRASGATTWLNTRVSSLATELGAAPDSLALRGFTDVTFHNADFSKTSKPTFTEPAAYLARKGALESALVAAATDAGATLVAGNPVARIRLDEKTACVSLEDGREFVAKLLLLAVGHASPLMERCGFRRGGAVLWTAQVDTPIDGGKGGEPRVSIVLGLDRGGSFAMLCTAEERQAVSVHWAGERSGAIPALINVCRLAFANQVVPEDASKEAARAKPVPSPAAAALDMDTHVGKHTLLIGDAGGFVSAASNEGIYPAMWSARIAAEVAESAFGGTYSQDELMAFDSRWRIEMADYLRAPNTDTQFLLPLIFSNQNMADRMGAAFFSGENI